MITSFFPYIDFYLKLKVEKAILSSSKLSYKCKFYVKILDSFIYL